MNINQVNDPNNKRAVCAEILYDLPHWFGIRSSIDEYVNEVVDCPFFAAYHDHDVMGFCALKAHNQYTAEILVMGVRRRYHRQGAGTALIRTCEEYAVHHHLSYLTVKTLDESNNDQYYAQTRLFYFAAGFRPLEVFPSLWDESNPCLFMVKTL